MGALDRSGTGADIGNKIHQPTDVIRPGNPAASSARVPSSALLGNRPSVMSSTLGCSASDPAVPEGSGPWCSFPATLPAMLMI